MHLSEGTEPIEPDSTELTLMCSNLKKERGGTGFPGWNTECDKVITCIRNV